MVVEGEPLPLALALVPPPKMGEANGRLLPSPPPPPPPPGLLLLLLPYFDRSTRASHKDTRERRE